MSDENQIEIPPSFIALFVPPGRQRPNASREAIASRYELCEDMACMLSEHAQTMQVDLCLTEDAVLQSCHLSLKVEDSAFSEQEAEWVIRRLAELLDWKPLMLGNTD